MEQFNQNMKFNYFVVRFYIYIKTKRILGYCVKNIIKQNFTKCNVVRFYIYKKKKEYWTIVSKI